MNDEASQAATVTRYRGIASCRLLVLKRRCDLRAWSTCLSQGRNQPICYSRLAFAPVTIEDECDIGVGVIILPRVTIAQGTQVGVGAVVDKDLPPYAMTAGVPARVRRTRP